jgi:oligopeptide/dipeptide ABC transporter ATP-binding protein
MSKTVLRMDGVSVALKRRGRLVPVVEDLSLRIGAGEMLAIVGESGSGKTIAALSIPRLLPADAAVTGQIMLAGDMLAGFSAAEMRAVRGARIGMVFQDPLAALNPSHSIGEQIAEPMRLHLGASRAGAWRRAIDLLAEVGFSEPRIEAHCYPHQLSGGMRQRAMIAVALSCGPELLIADEPTTGLDAILKHQMLDLLVGLQAERQLAVLLVSHDLSLVRRHADSVLVMYAGRTMERGSTSAVFAAARHPYTAGLLQATSVLGRPPVPIPGHMPAPELQPPGCGFAARCEFFQAVCGMSPPPLRAGDTEAACFFPRMSGAPAISAERVDQPAGKAGDLLNVERLTVRYRFSVFGGRGAPAAVDEVSLTLGKGECLAVVGASGSGKTSLGRAVLQIVPYEGSVVLDSVTLGHLRGKARRAARRRLGIVFQDPASSLNPAMTVAALIGEAIRLGGGRDTAPIRRRVLDLLESLALPSEILSQYPSSLSGGQAQRVAFARALAAEPDVLVLDEPTSSLDVSSQAVLLGVLRDLVARRGLSCIIITHDVAAVAFMVHRFAVMYDSRIVEVAPKDSFLRAPRHPHSAMLVKAASGDP